VSVTFADTQQARAAARRFIDAFNERDVETLGAVATDDVEVRRLTGETLRGRDGLSALVQAAVDQELRLVPLRAGTVREDGGDAVRVDVPARELIGPDDIERLLEFEVRDGRISAFAVRTAE
jgi:hypothetical protein